MHRVLPQVRLKIITEDAFILVLCALAGMVISLPVATLRLLFL